MPRIQPIPAITYATTGDQSPQIAPPYDVLDESSKADLLQHDARNIVAVDLPHLPPKTVGPDATYEQAGATWRQWLEEGVLTRQDPPAIYVYQQSYTDPRTGQSFARRGLFANVRVRPFGPATDGSGGIHPHEQTFSAPKEDRLKLMRATRTQLSPIFGLYSDAENNVGPLLARFIEAGPGSAFGITRTDNVKHEIWPVTDEAGVRSLVDALAGRDVFIADGHHRYNTALTYREEIAAQYGGELPDDHPANWCMFVLVAIQDPGMIVLPTHRVLGGMKDFSLSKLEAAAGGAIKLTPFQGDAAALEQALPQHGPHAMGLASPGDDPQLAILTTTEPDPLASLYGEKSEAWRQLDVAVLQHLIVEKICQPTFCDAGQEVTWKFPHTLDQLHRDVSLPGYQLGVIVQPTPLESVRLVSEAGELMPQKSTFFYPKLATGLVMNPLE